MVKHERKLLGEFVLRYKSVFILAFLSAVAGSITNILIPLSIGYYQSLFSNGEGGKLRLLHALGLHIDSINGFFLFFSILVIMRFVLAWGENYFFQRISENWSATLRDRLFSTQLTQSPMVFGKKQPGYYLLRFASDMNSTRNLVTKGFVKGISDSVMILVALMVFFWIDPTVGITVMAFLLIAFPMITLVAVRTGKLHAAAGDLRSNLMRVLTDTYYGFKSIKSMNSEKKRFKIFQKTSTQLLDQSLNTSKWIATENALTEVLSFITIGLVLFISFRIHSTSYDNGTLLSIILVLLYMRGPIRRLLKLPSVYTKGMSGLGKIANLTQLPHEKPSGDPPRKKELMPIRLEKLVLVDGHDSFEAEIPAGSVAVINGAHGSGKSRLLECLIQLAYPVSGNIYLGSENLNLISPFDNRRIIALVSDHLLPEGHTIADFIRSASTEKRTAEAHHFYSQFESSFAALNCGGNFEAWGQIDVAKLSESQIRLLKLIRALLSGKKIICIDGQFNHFSMEENRKLAEIMVSMKGKCTFVLTSHYLPPGLNPDINIQLP